MDDVTIRRATTSDTGEIAHLAVRAYAHYVDRMDGQRPAPMDADYAGSIARDAVWVVEVGEQLAGFLVLVEEPSCMLVEGITVHPRWQRRGVGRRLMALAESEALASGKGRLRLYTHVSMHENRRYYAQLGYVETGRSDHAGFARVAMTKSLVRPM